MKQEQERNERKNGRRDVRKVDKTKRDTKWN